MDCRLSMDLCCPAFVDGSDVILARRPLFLWACKGARAGLTSDASCGSCRISPRAFSLPSPSFCPPLLPFHSVSVAFSIVSPLPWVGGKRTVACVLRVLRPRTGGSWISLPYRKRDGLMSHAIVRVASYRVARSSLPCSIALPSRSPLPF